MAGAAAARSTIREAMRLVRRAAGRLFVFTTVLDLLGALTGAAVIVFAGRVLGQLAEGATFDTILPSIVAITIATALGSLTAVGRSELSNLAIEQVEAAALQEVLQAATSVPYRMFDEPGFYDHLRRAFESGTSQAWSIVQSVVGLVRSVVDVIAIVGVLIWIAPSVIAVAAVAYVPLLVVNLLNSRILHQFSWELTEPDRRRTYLAELLSDRASAQEARVFGLFDSLGQEHRAIWDDRLHRLSRLLGRRIAIGAIGNLLAAVIMAAALGLVVWLTTQGTLSIADAGVGVLAVRRLTATMNQAGGAVAGLNSGRLHLRDYQTFLDRSAPAIAEIKLTSNDTMTMPVDLQDLVLDNVGFRYQRSSTWAVRELSTTIRSGQVTAIVGANGSGKSTLFSLLARLYDPGEGSISWDGADITGFALADYYDTISILGQRSVRYELIARENLSIALRRETRANSAGRDLDATTRADLIERAVDRAGVRPLVDRLAGGLDTQLGRAFTTGTELSGGEWQRLGLARSLVRDAPLLLLDEPAAALDAEAELELVAELKQLAADRCVVYISHRFASVSRADRILVLHEGRLAEDGSHEELLATNGVYASMFKAQIGLSREQATS